MVSKVFFGLCITLAAGELAAATPDVVVVGPTRAAQSIRTALVGQLEERVVVVRKLPRRRPAGRDLVALARSENAAIVVHIDPLGRRGWRVRAVTEDGRTLVQERMRGRRFDRQRVVETIAPELARTLIADYPPPRWQPEAPRPVVPKRGAPVKVIDEGPNRLKRVVLQGYGRTYAAIDGAAR